MRLRWDAGEIPPPSSLIDTLPRPRLATMRAAPRAWINALPTKFAKALRTAASTPSTTTLPCGPCSRESSIPASSADGIELSLEQGPQGSVVVLGVEAAVRSALANLVGNALIHARGAARLVANLGRGSVSISDDGGGISPASHLKRIHP